MELAIYQVDAFASEVFEGNPAAVCPLDNWLADETLQKIAEENNLSETAFFVKNEDTFSLRWFTPEAEVDLCGHATLAAAHVLFTHLRYSGQTIQFDTKSGPLLVQRSGVVYSMDFPASIPVSTEAPDALIDGLGITPREVLCAYDYIAVLGSETDLKSVKPNFIKLSQLDKRGVVITAPGASNDIDFVSRCFYPKLKVNEDPVTGSAHCQLAPYWSQQFKKDVLLAKQLSKRTGLIHCELHSNRVSLKGGAVDYLHGSIKI
ncbi:PhzF family phenazine biosynthesis protein [Microbulbifer sp. VAAF005]|uniref:PhzF family phenazine biosynthesis protein n=1 Tax=Microbulbifer sp. VAAF005 TaxID=3034230 RepID=UPI0024ADFD22|nr:PhzF family phenazine biosynthesis protein [Microbulbifer sp. VAAF005]WHI47745.1 PhzF family phenazine biosynthesis protein [Microbulbifer sp. VAAF005]